jgi:hypothetical protein
MDAHAIVCLTDTWIDIDSRKSTEIKEQNSETPTSPVTKTASRRTTTTKKKVMSSCVHE